MLAALNRKIRNISIQELKINNPKIMDFIKEQYNIMIHAFERSEDILSDTAFRTSLHECCKCGKVLANEE